MNSEDKDFDLGSEDEIEFDLGSEDISLDDMLEAEEALSFNIISTLPQSVIVEPGGFDDLVQELDVDSDIMKPSRGLFGAGDQLAIGHTEEPQLLIEGGFDDDSEFDLNMEDIETELVVYDIKTDLVEYNQEDARLESMAIQYADRDVHNALVDINQFSRKAFEKIRAYLNSPQFDIIPTVVFDSDKFRREQDFRSWLVKQFINMINVEDSILPQDIIDIYFEIYKDENIVPKLTEHQKKRTIELILNFISFSKSVYDIANREASLVSYKYDEDIIIKTPKLVTNFTYVCECDNEVPMLKDSDSEMARPTMCFLIRKSRNKPQVNLINPPIQCTNCGEYLALPSRLAEKISVEMTKYLDSIKARYEEDRIYRPKISDLMNFIPANIHSMFVFEGAPKIVDDSQNSNSSYQQVGRNYVKLINVWMDQVINDKIKSDLEMEYDTDGNLRLYVQALSLVTLGKEPDLEVYQFMKTLLHYLETFSNFCISYKNLAFFEYCRRANINSKPISDEVAIDWMYSSSEYLASLKNLYPGDKNITEFYIRKEYIPVINHIICLRLLSEEKLIGPESELAKWIKTPTAKIKKLSTIMEKENTHVKNMVSVSARDLIPRGTFYSIDAWSDVYSLLKEVASECATEDYEEDYLDSLIDEVNSKSIEEFYGEEYDDNSIIKKTYRQSDFEKAFYVYGHFLFTDVIIDLKKRNICSFLKLIIYNESENAVLFVRNKKSTTDISKVLLKHQLDPDLSKNILVHALNNENITSDVSARRDEVGGEGIVKSFSSFVEYLRLDANFNKRFGDLFNDVTDGV